MNHNNIKVSRQTIKVFGHLNQKLQHWSKYKMIKAHVKEIFSKKPYGMIIYKRDNSTSHPLASLFGLSGKFIYQTKQATPSACTEF